MPHTRVLCATHASAKGVNCFASAGCIASASCITSASCIQIASASCIASASYIARASYISSASSVACASISTGNIQFVRQKFCVRHVLSLVRGGDRGLALVIDWLSLQAMAGGDLEVKIIKGE